MLRQTNEGTAVLNAQAQDQTPRWVPQCLHVFSWRFWNLADMILFGMIG